MINPSICPLCKCTIASYKCTITSISDDKNKNLVKSDSCKDFVITDRAWQKVLTAVMKKAQLHQESESMKDDKMLYIFINDHDQFCSQPIKRNEVVCMAVCNNLNFIQSNE